MIRQAVLEDIVRQLVELLANASHEHGWYEISADLSRLSGMLQSEEGPWDQLKDWERLGLKLNELDLSKPLPDQIRVELRQLVRARLG